MALMLVHDSEPPRDEPPARRPFEPNWRVVAWLVAAIVVGYAALNAEGALGALLAIAAFGVACQAIAQLVPLGNGLREWRQ